jgi:iron complex transport system ATP-binding protein
MKKTLMQVRDLTIGYSKRPLYTGISFDICEGDLILLCGANGSGKTTLLKALANYGQQADIAMIPTRIPKIKGFTLNEFIQLSCYNFTGAEPEEAMFKLGLSHLTDRDISTLSDGEFQKGTIAAAIAKGARIILLDEPTAFLDVQNRRNVLATLRSLCEETGSAVIFSSHDLHESLNVCSKVIALGADRQCHISSEDLNATASAIFSKD